MANRGRTLDQQVYCIKDLERIGSAKMEKSYREYYNEGAMDLITLRANESAYDRYMIRPRVLRKLSTLDTSTTIVGCKVKFPFGFSPTAHQKLAHPDGEEATSRACANLDTLMGLSNYSTIELEKVISHSKGNPYVMQMSLLKNKDAMVRMIKRAEAAGFKALFVTLDVPYLGRRLNEFRNNFGVPQGMEYPNLFPGVDVTNLEDGDDSMAYDNDIEWSDIMPFFRKHTKMQIWGKGIYTAADAELAIQHGFDGIVISNHGGRQLDSVPASLDVLREVVPVAKGKIPIAVDGGIRRGTDIFKALALGADFCLAGRPAIWGLAYDGQRGVELALNLLYDEFRTCMALAGCKSVSEIQREHVSLLQPDGRLLKL
ncbi:alpha-hydroxy acid oxidase [Aspergillus mulundensis]|uniref:Oxidase FUB9 n=1 Tax=Aspergillus mulundensis TaxID=1810919 RepID=A0A3D8S4P1_9EURO|nr:Aldolase-type TIM barrel [Aspergillus mulundensis]RDW81024.1 Aldolase-type TIM barrel [Aspergillus mulundensis]